jgi:ABC-type bacteriocin/lantibiotic exporter with double-glycine peptidase domain
MQLMQFSIVEALERRIFVKAAFEFSFRIPRIRAEALLGEYAPELMNRFFDVLTIQKGMPKLLIDVTSSVLQIFFGLVLLAFYNPFFAFFGVGLLVTIILVFYFSGPQGLKSSLKMSKYKYKVAHWLEELARVLYSFKLAGHSNLPFERMDNYVDNYLHYRRKRFQTLMVQFVSVAGFKVLAMGGFLLIGSYLVVERAITIGQFVASEIVVITMLAASEKFVLSMSTIYDMLTAVEKIGQVTDIPLERKGGITLPYVPDAGTEIEIKNLSYKYPESDEYAIKNVNLKIKAGERVGIAGYSASGKNTLLRVLSGLLESYEGIIKLNNVSMRDINLATLRDSIAKSVSKDDIFDGNVLDNISMGQSKVSYQDVMWALKSVGLEDMISALPDGLMTEMVSSGKSFSASTATKMIIARCIAEKPQMLILNDIMHDLEKGDRMNIMRFLISEENPWTLLIVSNDPLVLAACDRVIVMQDGEIIANEPYIHVIENPHFRKCVIEGSSIT